MSTRSYICRECEDGRYKGIYCHFDGYPEHHGKILLKNYSDDKKLDELLSLGDIATLGESCAFDPTLPQERRTVAYCRDRGEHLNPARFITPQEAANGKDYMYVWGLDGKWWYYELGKDPDTRLDLQDALYPTPTATRTTSDISQQKLTTAERQESVQESKPKLTPTRQALVDMVLSALDKEELPWQNPVNANVFASTPRNGVTNKNYRGENAIALWLVSCIKGYKDPRWFTFNQAKNKGYSVKKGEHGSHIDVLKIIDKRTQREADMSAVKKELEALSYAECVQWQKENLYFLRKSYTVFNGEQIDGLDLFKPPVVTEIERNELCEQCLNASPAPILYDARIFNFYDSQSDQIHLVNRNAFVGAEEFYATALHEIAHSTGHFSRLNRLQDIEKATAARAHEELVAELASVMCASGLYLNPTARRIQNAGAYFQSWAKAIRESPNELFSVIADANRAADYVLFPEHRLEYDNASKEIAPKATDTEPKQAKAPDYVGLTNISNIPQEMKQMPNWCAVKITTDANGNKKKTLYDPNKTATRVEWLTYARPDNAKSFSTLETATAFVKKYKLDGVAFWLENSGVFCVDLDHISEHGGKDGKLSELAQSLIDKSDATYAERSVSGDGIHIFFKGALSSNHGNRNDKLGIEAYDKRRIMTITGNILGGATSEVKEAPQELMAVLRKSLPEHNITPKTQLVPLSMSDVEILDTIRQSKRGKEFERLWSGEDIMGNHSVSDYVLCNIVGFFCGGDAVRTERLFRQSGLYREKKGDAYVRRTCQKACDHLQSTYKPKAVYDKPEHYKNGPNKPTMKNDDNAR